MGDYLVGIIVSVTAFIFVVELLRRRIISEKFSIVWLIVTGSLLLFAIFPGLLQFLTTITGFSLPSNFLFAALAIVLLIVSIQMSFEIGRIEKKLRFQAEEIALINTDLRKLSREIRRSDKDPQ